jgi:hypothetical protein
MRPAIRPVPTVIWHTTSVKTLPAEHRGKFFGMGNKEGSQRLREGIAARFVYKPTFVTAGFGSRRDGDMAKGKKGGSGSTR